MGMVVCGVLLAKRGRKGVAAGELRKGELQAGVYLTDGERLWQVVAAKKGHVWLEDAETEMLRKRPAFEVCQRMRLVRREPAVT
jgi:hypothetical protein